MFEDGNVKLDVLPKCYIENVADELLSVAFEATDLLTEDVALE